VLGMAYLALQITDDPQQRVYLNKIQRSCAHLMHIIDDILDISKIDAGKLVLEN
jgi:signal transduction histidine kinase